MAFHVKAHAPLFCSLIVVSKRVRIVSLALRDLMRLKDIPRKLLAVVALFALLAASTPALAESLSASDSLVCCKTAYCPVHHRQVRDMPNDKSNCHPQTNPPPSHSSIPPCNPPPNH